MNGDNNPPQESISFETSEHIRYKNGENISGYNYGCNRRFVIEKNKYGGEGYSVTLYNLDCVPLQVNHIQIFPQQMQIVCVDNNIVELRSDGVDQYGLLLFFKNEEIDHVQLNIYDQDISIVYFKSNMLEQNIPNEQLGSKININEFYSQILTRKRRGVSQCLVDKFDEVMSKFVIQDSWTQEELVENINQYIKNNYQRIKKIVWIPYPYLVYMHDRYATSKSPITKYLLEKHTESFNLLESISSENLNFIEIDGATFLKTNNGFMIEIKIDKNGNIRLLKDFITEEGGTIDSNKSDMIITERILENLLAKFNLAIIDDVSDLLDSINGTDDIKTKIDIITEYINKRREKKIGPKSKRILERFESFIRENNHSSYFRL